MANRDKVIKGLECCTQHGNMCGCDCNGHWGWTDDSHTGMELLDEYRTKCPYGNCEIGCVKTLAKDALTLLKTQQPRVLTLEEVEDALDTVVWVDRPQIENFSDEYAVITAYSHKFKWVDLKFIDGDEARWTYEQYGKLWRCWDKRPYEEERKAVAWDA